ncbi:putative membrane protein YphA (DoxX/SURF4 family) [Nocardioides thalensis]|uniref:Putative membrane protein YphA (DoxX/SURF4 family) n=1 Tax=Nocardioides thalensis TaxID=1914755 RepID=A0A853C7L3_9ACTN|nr:hypothetical protein [Nocardioides thalensis]NYJ03554.1 putative membrane protein YphA (DoxX/SURF4 family) [Nocardioides thalensis]
MARMRIISALVLLGAASMILVGVWCRVDPAGFAEWAGWPNHEHFLHDAGVFQIAIGLMMALGLWCRDALTVGLAGFVFTNLFHAQNHFADRADGGRDGDWIQLLVLAGVGAIALFLRLRLQRTTATTP